MRRKKKAEFENALAIVKEGLEVRFFFCDVSTSKTVQWSKRAGIMEVHS